MAEKSKILFIGKHIVEASAKAGHPTFALVSTDPAKAHLLNKFKTLGVNLVPMAPTENDFPTKDFREHYYRGAHQVPVWPFFLAAMVVLVATMVFLYRVVYPRLAKWRGLAKVAPAPDSELELPA